MKSVTARVLRRAPVKPNLRSKRLQFEPTVNWLNHRSFRYPAKFHPPVARALVERFTSPGDLVLDPFVGSGTLLVESMVLGRHSLGYDIDPLAVFVTKAKTQLYDPGLIEKHANKLAEALTRHRQRELRGDTSFETDISLAAFKRRVATHAGGIPPIPRIEHWFRLRVLLQLSTISELVREHSNDHTRPFFELCFASIIRNASNADPVPVSGLEVTAHMRRLEEKGRSIDPYDLMLKSIRKNMVGAAQLREAVPLGVRTRAVCRNASAQWLDNVPKADVVITSPPYMSAVDYYRRHTLEMYWLGLVSTPDERIALLHNYIGRAAPSQRSMPPARETRSAVERSWIKALKREAPKKALTLEHYARSMEIVLGNQAKALKA